MKNKEQVNTENKTSMFDNLKNLNSIMTGKELTGVFANIKNAKGSLDGFCKSIKTKIAVSQKPTEVVAQPKQIVVQDVDFKQSIEPVVVAQPKVKVDKPKESFVKEFKQQGNFAGGRSEHQGSYNRNSTATASKTNSVNSYNNNRKFDPNRQQPRTGGTYSGQNNVRYNNPNTSGAGNFNRGQNAGYSNAGYNRNQQGATASTGYNNRNQAGRPPFGDRQQGNKPGFTPNANRGTFQKDGRANVSYTNAGAGQQGQRPKQFTKPETPILTANKPTHNVGNKNKTKSVDVERKGLNLREKIRLGHITFNSADDGDGVVKFKNRRLKQQKSQEKVVITNATITEDVLTVKILSERIGITASEILKKFILLGLMYNINSVIDYATAELVASEFGVTLEHKIEKSYEEKLEEMFAINIADDDSKNYVKRPPIVTVMGHVDHGKTSLLDYIKKSHVISDEAGGITQHIGAYSIKVKDNDITFIDTPGHAAFSEMRQRGATVADVAILIVAADDGVMPQTVEAIKYIKKANTPMIVAVNKIDKQTANIERIKQQLTEHEVLIEEWGGDTILVPISAHSGEGIDKLLEMILLVSDMNEFKANPKKDAIGVVIESKVDTGRGIVASIIVKDGTLNVGDYIVCGLASGRIRSMTDYKGNNVKQALPSMAVSVVGLNNIPDAGENAYVVDEKLAKNLISERSSKLQIEKTQTTSGSTLEAFMSQNADEEIKTYKVLIKGDVHGTTEALKYTLEAVRNDEVVVSCISSGVGIINETDVIMAKTANAKLIGFNTKLDAKARQVADKNDVDIKMFKIIYEAADYIQKEIDKLKTPKFRENITGKAEVRQLFKVSSLGVIAGSYVLDGTINRNSNVKVYRNDKLIAETSIDTLKQQKEDTKQVRSGFECGIKLKDFNDILVGDIIVGIENIRID